VCVSSLAVTVEWSVVIVWNYKHVSVNKIANSFVTLDLLETVWTITF